MTNTALQPDREAAPAPATPFRLIAALAIYVLLLVWIVLWKLELPWVGGVDRVIKLVPFVATAEQGASRPSEVIVNLLLFVPLGLFLGLLAPRWSWRRLAGVAATVSLALEATQFVLAIGSTDATDVLVNTAGALIGFGLVAFTRLRSRERARGILVRVCVVGTLLAVLAVALFIASPIHFRPPPAAGLGPAASHAIDGGGVGDELP
ncbi:VanZ family protein [Microbacterium sp. ZW CA_36]|uniref:VanZ family protein n=1 Tax=Microbacterium sp. ZW CA_36 TaxID=3378078 RepID=UPI00385542B3